MSTDFYDDDLAKGSKPRGEITAEPGATEVPPRGVSDLNLTRMARQREQMDEHMAHAAQELERLRQQQEKLEKERATLEDMRKRQSEYERSKREMLDHLHHSAITLEKEELNAAKLLEVVTNTRQQCRSWLGEIDSINEEEWTEEHFREKLTTALTRIEDMRLEYNKSLAKIETLSKEEHMMAAVHQPMMYDEAHSFPDDPKSFAHWLKLGFAVSLPLVITLVVLWILFYMHTMGML